MCIGKLFCLLQGAGGGTVVYQLVASDNDAGKNKLLTYAITSGGEDGRFILNSATGILHISPTGLDREISSSYNLTINVTDAGSPVQWVSGDPVSHLVFIHLLLFEFCFCFYSSVPALVPVPVPVLVCVQLSLLKFIDIFLARPVAVSLSCKRSV